MIGFDIRGSLAGVKRAFVLYMSWLLGVWLRLCTLS